MAVLSAQVEKCPANQYTITFDTAGGSYIAPITQGSGTAVTAPANPSKSGFVFAGWDIEIPETMPAENITITAKWYVKSSKVQYCKSCGKLLNYYTATITGLRGVLEGTPVYWIKLHCCGYRTSIIESSIISKE